MFVTTDPLFVAEWILIYEAFGWISLVTVDAFRRGVLSDDFAGTERPERVERARP